MSDGDNKKSKLVSSNRVSNRISTVPFSSRGLVGWLVGGRRVVDGD